MVKYIIKEWIIPIIIAFVIVFMLNRFVFILVTVPTGSMENTIMPGDRLYVSKIFNAEQLEVGDVVVFKSDELEKILVKRLMGMPGDEVYIDESGKFFINGTYLEEPYAKIGGQTAQLFNVPEGKYFFVGDNRTGSHDGRSWNNPFIEEDQLIGIALFRFFPFNRIGKIY